MAGVTQHIVVASEETAVKVGFAKAYHLVCLAKNGTIPLFVRWVELARLPTKREDGCQLNVWIVGFHRQQRFSRKHIKTYRHSLCTLKYYAKYLDTNDCITSS